MNQLTKTETTDLDKVRHLKMFLRDDHAKSYKKAHCFDGEVSYHYFHFVPFCHAYAEYLLSNGSFTVYEGFIKEFNRLIENDSTHLHMKSVQDLQISYIGGLSFLNTNYSKAFIKDKRPLIEGREFKFESDLERIIESELKDFFGDEGIRITRQQQHGYGKSDITINNKITIELKKSAAKRMNVYQTFEYSFDDNLDDVCLLASDFDEKALSIANKLGISCYTYSFMYEENTNEYPKGFVIEKANQTRTNLFDEYLEAMDECFWISFYNHLFDINEEIQQKREMVNKINDLTHKIHEENVKRIFIELEKQGYDTSSQDLGIIIQQIKEQEVI